MNKKRDYIALCCLLALILCIVFALLAPVIAPFDPNAQDLANKLEGVSATHWLGTDQLGRDIFSRLLYGGRVTLLMGVVLTLVILGVGLVLGVVAACGGKKWDQWIMGICHLFLALPSEMLALTIIAIVGPSFLGLVLAITLTRWPWYVKMIRQDVMEIMNTDYVIFAKLAHKSLGWILWHHVLRNKWQNIVVYATMDMGALIMSIASLSFLGIGVQPPTAEWGRMLNDAREISAVDPWQMVPAGAMIFIVTALLNYLGDAFSEWALKGEKHAIKN